MRDNRHRDLLLYIMCHEQMKRGVFISLYFNRCPRMLLLLCNIFFTMRVFGALARIVVGAVLNIEVLLKRTAYNGLKVGWRERMCFTGDHINN